MEEDKEEQIYEIDELQDNGKVPISQRYTSNEVAAIIYKNLGIADAVCADLQCTRFQYAAYLRRHSGLKKVVERAKQGLVDVAESVLWNNLNCDDRKIQQKAAEFVLKGLGRESGWNSDQPSVQINQNIVTDDQKRVEIKNIFGIDKTTDEPV